MQVLSPQSDLPHGGQFLTEEWFLKFQIYPQGWFSGLFERNSRTSLSPYHLSTKLIDASVFSFGNSSLQPTGTIDVDRPTNTGYLHL